MRRRTRSSACALTAKCEGWAACESGCVSPSVGHVDHGKSALIGRLLHDTGTLPEGKVEVIEEMCRRRSMPFEWAFAIDAFQDERDQAVTIDAAHVWFRSGDRDYAIVDAPDHREFVRNLVSGTSSCDAGVLVIDAEEGAR